MSEEFPIDHGAKSPGDPSKDLFGEPAGPHRDPRWRKKLKLTNGLSNKVAVLRAGGMDRQQIADAIGCCRRRSKLYFLPSLNEGREAKCAEAIARAYQLGVIDGNVTALKPTSR